jgi:uridine kinase
MSGGSVLRNPVFLTGLAVRIGLIAVVAPAAVVAWFAPFLSDGPGVLTLDPWGAWLSGDGSDLSFPYGYAMWLYLKPIVAVLGLAGVSPAVGYMVALLLADVALLALMHRLLPGHNRAVTLAYWLSPITIIAIYVFGANDVVPIAFLVAALVLLQGGRPTWAGALLALAVASKLSMLLAVPFLAILLIHNKSMRRQGLPMLLGFAPLALLLAGVPLALSADARTMVLGNPEVAKIYDLGLQSLGVTLVYLVPLAYVLLLYSVWRVRRPNLALITSLMGLSFLLVVLMTPASPGWFVWVVPFLVVYQVTNDRTSRVLAAVFSLLFGLGSIVVTPFIAPTPTTTAVVGDVTLPLMRGGTAATLIHTALVAVGLVLAVRVWRQAVRRNDYFRLSQTPFLLGVAGDSGAGKDTYAAAVGGLFGTHSVAQVSGDDYHLWDRQRPMWRAMTHLNPFANDLEGFTKDVLALADGRSVQARRYDHAIGRRGRVETVRSNDFIVASGLHALSPPLLLQRYGLRVYLDMDEALRRALKIQRDVRDRGHEEAEVLASMDQRAHDAARFIRPQEEHADVVFSVIPVAGQTGPVPDGSGLTLVTRSRQGFDWRSIHRVLAGVIGLHVDVSMQSGVAFPTVVSVEGGAGAPDVAWAARLACPRMFDFLDDEPQWRSGTLGLMQLMTLAHIDHALTRRSFDS